jgi:hypothetical protein
MYKIPICASVKINVGLFLSQVKHLIILRVFISLKEKQTHWLVAFMQILCSALSSVLTS